MKVESAFPHPEQSVNTDTESEELIPDANQGISSAPSAARQRVMMASILGIELLILCVDTAIYPFFPPIAKSKGLTATHIGLVFSCYELSRFVSSPIFGSQLVKWNPKIMCATGGVVVGLACISYGPLKYVSHTYIFLGFCVLLRLVAGCGSALLTVFGMSILLKSTAYSSTTIIGAAEMVEGAGFAMGPALGAGLFVLGGYEAVFLTIGSIVTVFGLLLLLLIPDVEAKENPTKSFADLLRIPGILVLFIHCVVVWFVGESATTQLSLFYTDQFGTSEVTLSLLFVMWSVIYILFCQLASKVIDKGFVYSSLLVGWAAYILINLLLGPSPWLDFAFNGNRYFGLTTGATVLEQVFSPLLFIAPFHAAFNLAVTNGYPEDSLHTYGLIVGLTNCGFGLGAVLGPLVSGAITQALGFPWMTSILAIESTLMFGVFCLFLVGMRMMNKTLAPEKKRQEKEENSSSVTNGLINNKLEKCFQEAMKEGIVTLERR